MVLITIVTGAFVNQLSYRTGASHCRNHQKDAEKLQFWSFTPKNSPSHNAKRFNPQAFVKPVTFDETNPITLILNTP